VPVAPAVIVSQLALLDADHPQPPAVRTSNDPAPPPAGLDADGADSENVQPCPWMIVTVRPAMASVPVRDGPVVAATVKLTEPFPLPLAPDAIVIHASRLEAVHAHPVPAVTATAPVAPDAGTFCVSGEIANVQPWPCTTVTVWPATTSVPVRDGPVVASTARLTEPDPLPLAPDVSEIHGALLVAVQPQPAAAPTLTSSGPPLAPVVRLSGDTSKLQPGDCVTVKDCPATVTVPVRDGPSVAATVKLTAPLPDPPVVPIEIQLTLLAAVHGQPAPAVTAIVPAPPAAPAAKVAGAIVNAQPSDWVTLKESPAIFRLPVRGGPDVGATVKATGADPLPLAPEVMVIQSASEAAVQVHSALEARTPTLPLPPAVANEAELSASENTHSAAACVIWARLVFTVMPPVRTTGSGLAAAANWTVPSP
jgi:hypothetical protein